MQKAQRLLDLAALLLRAAEPVSWREIQEQFPEDYAGSGEAAIRKFERDKAELLELGIPVRWVQGDEDLPAGYVIDKDEFYLPNLELAPEDLALLYVSGSAALAQGAFPYAKDLAHAMNKLSFAARAAGSFETAGMAAHHLSQGDEASGAGAVAPRLEALSS
ncbi:MAG: WYL domain-containing protein, partial [Anaeromyxobacteraceae bacterium]